MNFFGILTNNIFGEQAYEHQNKAIFFPVGVRFRNSSSRGNFGDSLLEMDDSIGRIISTVKKVDKLNNTIIIFTSDNG